MQKNLKNLNNIKNIPLKRFSSPLEKWIMDQDDGDRTLKQVC
jgi:hypothetical protein